MINALNDIVVGSDGIVSFWLNAYTSSLIDALNDIVVGSDGIVVGNVYDVECIKAVTEEA